MAANSRFAVAVHVVTTLTHRGEEWMSSEAIARSVNTNPVVVRRIVRARGRSRLVRSHPGKAGGMQLARRAEQISRLDIFCAIERQCVFAFAPKPGNPDCPVGRNMKRLFEPIFDDSQRVLERSWSRTTIADLIMALPA